MKLEHKMTSLPTSCWVTRTSLSFWVECHWPYTLDAWGHLQLRSNPERWPFSSKSQFGWVFFLNFFEAFHLCPVSSKGKIQGSSHFFLTQDGKVTHIKAIKCKKVPACHSPVTITHFWWIILGWNLIGRGMQISTVMNMFSKISWNNHLKFL